MSSWIFAITLFSPATLEMHAVTKGRSRFSSADQNVGMTDETMVLIICAAKGLGRRMSNVASKPFAVESRFNIDSRLSVSGSDRRNCSASSGRLTLGTSMLDVLRGAGLGERSSIPDLDIATEGFLVWTASSCDFGLLEAFSPRWPSLTTVHRLLIVKSVVASLCVVYLTAMNAAGAVFEMRSRTRSHWRMVEKAA